MKLAVTCPMFWPTKEDAYAKAWLYLASAKHAGVQPEQFRPYGIGSTFYKGTAPMRFYDQIAALREMAEEGFTHSLFSDAWDVLFVQPLDTIIEKYKRMGGPPYLSGACPTSFGFCDIHGEERFNYLFDLTKPFPFPALNFHIGEIPHIISQLEKIAPGAHNESDVLLEAFKDGLELVMDHECEIFQEGGIHRGGEGTGVEMKDGRVFNSITGSYPGMVHFGGGFVSPENGKDDAIKPWAEKLGIIA